MLISPCRRRTITLTLSQRQSGNCAPGLARPNKHVSQLWSAFPSPGITGVPEVGGGRGGLPCTFGHWPRAWPLQPALPSSSFPQNSLASGFPSPGPEFIRSPPTLGSRRRGKGSSLQWSWEESQGSDGELVWGAVGSRGGQSASQPASQTATASTPQCTCQLQGGEKRTLQWGPQFSPRACGSSLQPGSPSLWRGLQMQKLGRRAEGFQGTRCGSLKRPTALLLSPSSFPATAA